MSDQPEESWLTYRELGAQLGCTANAARMHAHRRGWPRRAPNKVGDPAHVLVPGSLDVQSRATHDAALFVAQPNGFDRTHVQALVQALDVLREQLTKADQPISGLIVPSATSRRREGASTKNANESMSFGPR